MQRKKIGIVQSFGAYFISIFKIVYRNYKLSFFPSYFLFGVLILCYFLFAGSVKEGKTNILLALSTSTYKPEINEASLELQAHLLKSITAPTALYKGIIEKAVRKGKSLPSFMTIPWYRGAETSFFKVGKPQLVYDNMAEYSRQSEIGSEKFYTALSVDDQTDKTSFLAAVNLFFEDRELKEITRKKDVKLYMSDFQNGLASSLLAYMSSVQLRAEENDLYLYTEIMSKGFQENGNLFMILAAGSMVFIAVTSAGINFYKDLQTENLIRFFNIIGYSTVTQFLSVLLLPILLNLPTIFGTAFLLDSLIDVTEVRPLNILFYSLLIMHVLVLMYTFIISILNVLPQKLSGASTYIVIFLAVSTLTMPAPREGGLYGYLYYLFPNLAFAYIVDLQGSFDTYGFGILAEAAEPHKGSTLRCVLLTQLLLSAVLLGLSYLFFVMEGGLLQQLHSVSYKTTKKFYNLLSKRKQGIQEDRNSKLIKPSISAGEEKKKFAEQSREKLLVDNLTKNYTTFGSKFQALKGVSMTLNKGEKVAILGHNGCGKTTCISTLVGSVNRTSGSVYLDGAPVNGPGDLCGRLGYCPQFTKTVPSLTVIENIGLVAGLYGFSTQDLRDLLTELDLHQHQGKNAQQLSGGQRRKLGFLMAVVSQAPLIILDEPTTGIDVRARKVIFDILRRLSRESIVIFSTHLIEEAENYADRVAILSQGSLMAFDTVTNIKRKFNIVQNRLKVNFAVEATQEAKQRLVEELQTKFGAGLLKQHRMMISLTLGSNEATKLSELYAFMETAKQQYGVESFGVTKASLEEVLGLAEFREISPEEAGGTKQAELQIPTRNAHKRVTVLSSFKALLYHCALNVLLDPIFILTLVVWAVLLSMFFWKTRYDTTPSTVDVFSGDNPHFSAYSLDPKKFGLGEKRKLVIKTVGYDLDTGFYKFLKEKSSMKQYISVSKAAYVTGATQAAFQKANNIADLYTTEEFDLLALKLDQDVMKSMFGTEISKNLSITKRTQNNVVLKKSKVATFELLHSLLLLEYLNSLQNPNKKCEARLAVGQFAGLYEACMSINSLLQGLMPLGVLTLTLFALSAKLSAEHTSGIYTIWEIVGLGPVAISFFNALVFLVLSAGFTLLPIFFANLSTPVSLAGVYSTKHVTNLLLLEFVFLLLFNFIAKVGGKVMVSGVRSTLIIIAVSTLTLGNIINSLIDTDLMQRIVLFNPAASLLSLLNLFNIGEVTRERRGMVYMVKMVDRGALPLSKFAMADQLVAYFMPVFFATIGVLFLFTVLHTFKILSRLNEGLKRQFVRPLIRGTDKGEPSETTNSEEPALIKTNQLSKVYGHPIFFNVNHALSNFNFKAHRGESISVLGANGGGKSTLFKVFTREIPYTFGSTHIGGKELSRVGIGHMGYVPQYEALPQNMTPYQILRFYAILNGWSGPETEKYIQTTLDLMKLKKNKYKKVGQLSGGNKRKVVLAIAIMLNQELLVLDEPTTGVDISNCQDIWNVISEKTQDKTLLLASHSTTETEQLTDKIVILISGKVVASGTKETIREQHGKHYEVEIELHEDDPNLEQQKDALKDAFMKKYGMEKFEDKNNFKFGCYVNKKICTISELITQMGVWKEQFQMNEFFVNESTLENILNEKLATKQKVGEDA